MVQTKVIQFLINILDQKNRKQLTSCSSSALDKTVSKVAIALARLSQDSSTADIVIRQGGLRKLLDLVKYAPSKDNDIPMAIMVAVKTITSCCDVEYELEEGDSDEGLGSSESFV